MFDLFKTPADAVPPDKPLVDRAAQGGPRRFAREARRRAHGGVFARRTLDDETLEATRDRAARRRRRRRRDASICSTTSVRAGSARAPMPTRAAVLKAALVELLAPLEQPLVIGAARPFVIMLAGVNGAGKTTSIGKLAKCLQAQGHSVLLAAGDTFRAAAREQLAVWGERNGVAVIAQAGRRSRRR